MADDKSGMNLTSGSAVVAALAAMGLYYFHHEAPLVDLRPLAHANLEELATPQTVEARLWQDPFAAVEKARERSGKEDSDQCRDNPGLEAFPCKAPLNKEDQDTVVLAVTVPGAPYPEDAERRLRTRYAVLSGLEQAGFVPEDWRHIGYFVWTQSPRAAPFLLEEPPSLPLSTSVLQSAKHIAYSAPLSVPAPPLFGLSLGSRLHSPVPDSWLAEPAIVPYEWFKRVPEAAENKTKILIVWLKEDILVRRPLTTLSSFVSLLNRHDGKNIKIVGPFSSDLLHEMANEALTVDNPDDSGTETPWPNLKDIGVYAYGASAPDKRLFGNPLSLQAYFKEKLHIDLQRSIATDDALADGILNELIRRGVYPDADHKDEVALISEWDTFYGQTLPKVVEQKFGCQDISCDWIHKFTYLRGLDGLVPSAEGKEQTKADKTNASEEKRDTRDFFKIETDTQSLERPIGESQFDYLRRISEQLHKVDNDLRKQGNGKRIKAVGIFGGDVFDKLLILRALRPEFPEALFFTTDFDEALTIKSELPFTRNLIISSSFGPNLSDWLQGDIPYFRDTYETSAFLATRMAIGDPRINADDIAYQLSAARLFEIKRTGTLFPFAWELPLVPVSSSPQKQDGEHKDDPSIASINLLEEGRSSAAGKVQQDQMKWPCRKSANPLDCRYIQPVDLDELKDHRDASDPKPIEKPFPTFIGKSGNSLAASLALGAVFAVMAVWRRWLPNWRVELWFIALCFVGAAVACFFWEPIARYLTSDGHGAPNGEPIALLDGISIWPTVFLRLLSIILACYFIFRALFDLHANLKEIARDMGLDPPPKPFTTGFKLRSVFDFSLGGGDDKAAKSLPLQVKAAWRSYIHQEGFWPRIFRSAIYTGSMWVILRHVLLPLAGMPVNPHRSDIARDVYYWSVICDWILMQFLTFIVFDATCLCLFFIRKLSRDKMSWPDETLSIYDKKLWLGQAKLIHNWIGLEFVAKRTRCIGSLIYLPFVLIALLIVSRSIIFANYPPSVTILVSQGISLSVVFACAFMLWLAAKSARDSAKENLKDGLIRAKDFEGNVYFAGQLKSLLNRVEQLREGAFSPLSQQPLVRALLFPLSSAGWVALIQNGMLPGL